MSKTLQSEEPFVLNEFQTRSLSLQLAISAVIQMDAHEHEGLMPTARDFYRFLTFDDHILDRLQPKIDNVIPLRPDVNLDQSNTTEEITSDNVEEEIRKLFDSLNSISLRNPPYAK